MENRSVAVRTRSGEDLGSMPLDELIQRFELEVSQRA
jgi:threonyl-tRNA synthetase